MGFAGALQMQWYWQRIGGALGEVMEVDLFTMCGFDECIIKVLVNLDITKPLCRTMKIDGSNNKVIEVQLKYERIAGKEVKEGWGAWLRADQFGKRMTKNKENQDPNQNTKIEDSDPRTKRPTAVCLIRGLAGLSVNDNNSKTMDEDEEVQSVNRALVVENNSKSHSGNRVVLEEIRSAHKEATSHAQANSSATLVSIGASAKKGGSVVRRRVNIKKIARTNCVLNSTIGSKRNLTPEEGGSVVKKICLENEVTVERGMGATQQWAPKEV
ncbi:hypothetical protein PIB30_073532 [Stylosanthes scabra]|uniref:Uncharacterized protein n=1 Tax=Stylosanthes scabra TaxID=79078 RepID=A0ABU6SR80_9FABA|nr:hypothetical protein [Stylosanthes scabra]